MALDENDRKAVEQLTDVVKRSLGDDSERLDRLVEALHENNIEVEWLDADEVSSGRWTLTFLDEDETQDEIENDEEDDEGAPLVRQDDPETVSVEDDAPA